MVPYFTFGQADFGAEQVRLVQRLLPTLRQALEARRLLGPATPPGLAAATLAALTRPCLVVAEDRRIEYINPAAAAGAAAARRGGGLHVRFGRLQGLGDAGADVLDRHLIDAARGLAGRFPLALWRSMGSADPVRAACHVVPLRDSGLSGSWPRGIALFIIEIAPTEDEDRDWIHGPLARQYRLTQAECRVLTFLTKGEDVPMIATRLRIAPLTVRVDLRSLREKTGRRSQVHLVRLGLGR